MKYGLTALLSAASLCAFAWAAPAAAQTFAPAPYGYGYWSYPPGAAPTVPSHTGAPLYAYHRTGSVPAPNGQCEIIAGNRVCTAAPMYGYGYGYGPGGPFGAVVAAPVNAAGAFVAAPVAATGAIVGAPVVAAGATVAPLTGTPAYSYSSIPPAPAPGGGCDIIAGNRVCTAGYVP